MIGSTKVFCVILTKYGVFSLFFLLCGCSYFSCPETGAEYKKFNKSWNILKYTVNGRDATDSLKKAGFKEVSFFTNAGNRQCETIPTEYYADTERAINDSLVYQSVSGSWIWNEVTKTLKLRANSWKYSYFDSSTNSYKSVNINYIDNANLYYNNMPFRDDLNWFLSFQDTLIMTTSVDNINYKMLLK